MDYENDVLFDEGNLRSLESETRNQGSKLTVRVPRTTMVSGSLCVIVSYSIIQYDSY